MQERRHSPIKEIDDAIAWPKCLVLGADFERGYQISRAQSIKMDRDAIKAFVSNFPGLCAEIEVNRDGTVARVLSCSGLPTVAADDTVADVYANAYATGHAAGMAEGLVLGAESEPLFQDAKLDLEQLEQLLDTLEHNSAPTAEGARYLATALRHTFMSLLCNLGVKL